MLDQAAKENRHVAVSYISFNFKSTAVTPEVLTVQGVVELLNLGLFQRAASLLYLVDTQTLEIQDSYACISERHVKIWQLFGWKPT